MNSIRLSVVGVLAVSAASAAPAFAQSLEGDTLQAIVGVGTLPDLSLVLESTDIGPVVKGPADQAQIFGSDEYPVFLDVDPTTFTLDFASIGFGSGTSYDFNGVLLTGLDFPGDPERRITGARPITLTNAGTFGAKNLSITPDSIAVNLAGLSLNDATIAVEVLSRVDPMLVGDTAVASYIAGNSPTDGFVVDSVEVGPITDDASDETHVTGPEEYPLTVDLDGERLTVHVTSTGFGSSQAFNGIVVSDLDFADPNRVVTGLDLVSVINGDGFGASDLSLLADGQIALNFSGLSLNDTTIVVDLQSAIVPEPATAGTLAALATGLLLRRRR